jgi:predicted phage terminase large subunit-like protein
MTHRPDSVVIEKKASGQSLIQDLRLAGLPIQEYQPDRDKVARAYACSSLFHNSRIYAPLGKTWAKETIEECRQFPAGPHDDIVDSVTQAILYVRNGGYLEHSDNSWLDLDESEVYNRKRRRYY